MENLSLECLRCGDLREVERGPWRTMQAGECPRCGYLGWARAMDLSENARQRLRDRPPEARRLRVVA